MRPRWALFLLSAAGLLTSCAVRSQGSYEAQPAPEFLFERRPFTFECADRSPGHDPRSGRGAYLSAGNQAPFLVTRSEEATLSLSDVPALAITTDPSQSIWVGGSRRNDWSMRFCAQGEGNSEAEARQRRDQVSMSRLGDTVSLKGPILDEKPQARGSFVLDAPAEAPILIHASYTPVEVRDITGPVRVTATHARASILDTTGQVDVAAFVVDFAGSRGRVSLSAEAEINLKFSSARFDGSLLAWAQRPVRVLVPRGFVTPFRASVRRSQDFICRADLCAKVSQQKKNGLYVFTYLGDAGTAPEFVELYSEQSTVVIDTAKGNN